MARTLASATETEKEKVAGAFPRYILQVDFGGEVGIKYYSEELLHGPVLCEGRIDSWGELRLNAEPGKIGGFDQLTITFNDADRELRTLFETYPGVQNKIAYVYLWFDGTAWADKLVMFAGILTTPLSWTENNVQWSVSMKGLQEHFDKSIGRLISQDDFPEVNCSSCDGKMMPIVYGNPCKRVPACVIDRPGEGYLGSAFGQQDETVVIHDEASKLYFTTGSQITLIIGYPNNFESVVGSFANETSRFFNVTSRSSILYSGNVSGIYAAEGQRYIMINQSVLADPTFTLRGNPLWLNNGSGWYETMITTWDYQGSQVAIVQEPPDFTASSSTEFKIGSVAQTKFNWTPGAPVYELGTFKYLLNYLPSEEVVRIEALASSGSAGGGQTRDVFLTYNTNAYSVNLNDKSHNATIGRETDDPGLTTLTLNSPPTVYGFPEETIYATIKGIMNDEGDAIEDPADIMKHILESPFIGNIADEYINNDSFSLAASQVVTKMGFAIREEKKLNELISELAMQSNCIAFWDTGQIYLRYLESDYSNHQAVLNPDNVLNGSLSIEMTPVKDYPTEIVSKFRQAIPSPEQRLSRSSDEAIASFEKKRTEMDLWAYQYPTSVAIVTENWLLYRLKMNKLIKISSFLNCSHVQPGDVVLLNYADGNGGLVLDATYGRVRSISHRFGQVEQGTIDSIGMVVETNLWPSTVNVSTPEDQVCARIIGNAEDGGRGNPDFPSVGVPVTTTGEPTTTTTGEPTTTAPGTTVAPTTTASPFPAIWCGLPMTPGNPPVVNPGATCGLDFSDFVSDGCVSPETEAAFATNHTFGVADVVHTFFRQISFQKEIGIYGNITMNFGCYSPSHVSVGIIIIMYETHDPYGPEHIVTYELQTSAGGLWASGTADVNALPIPNLCGNIPETVDFTAGG